MEEARSSVDPDGSKDSGAFDIVGWNEDGTAWVVGNFGEIRMYSDPPVYRFKQGRDDILE